MRDKETTWKDVAGVGLLQRRRLVRVEERRRGWEEAYGMECRELGIRRRLGFGMVSGAVHARGAWNVRCKGYGKQDETARQVIWFRLSSARLPYGRPASPPSSSLLQSVRIIKPSAMHCIYISIFVFGPPSLNSGPSEA
jgi:hypothetical protein